MSLQLIIVILIIILSIFLLLFKPHLLQEQYWMSILDHGEIKDGKEHKMLFEIFNWYQLGLSIKLPPQTSKMYQ